MKRRWWKWFGLAAGLILCIEACMLMFEGPTGREVPLRYRISDWFDRMFAARTAAPGGLKQIRLRPVQNAPDELGAPEIDDQRPNVAVVAGMDEKAGISADWP